MAVPARAGYVANDLADVVPGQSNQALQIDRSEEDREFCKVCFTIFTDIDKLETFDVNETFYCFSYLGSCSGAILGSRAVDDNATGHLTLSHSWNELQQLVAAHFSHQNIRLSWIPLMT